MEFASPVVKQNNFSSFRNRSEQNAKTHYESSPGNGRFGDSPDFTPFNYSSPIKKERNMTFRGRNKRYFNNSDTSYSSGGSNFNTPYLNHRRNRVGYNRSSNGNSQCNISAYIDSSMTEDPWEELELKLEREQSIPESNSTEKNDKDHIKSSS